MLRGFNVLKKWSVMGECGRKRKSPKLYYEATVIFLLIRTSS